MNPAETGIQVEQSVRHRAVALGIVAADTLNMNAAAISTFKKRQNFVKALGAVVNKVPAINARAENATWEQTEMMLIPKCKNEKLLARYHGAFVL